MRLLALCLTRVALEDLGFSVGVISLSWFVPIIASGTRVSTLHDLAVQRRFQASWRVHACRGLDGNKWRLPAFNGACTHTHTHTSRVRTSGATCCPFDPRKSNFYSEDGGRISYMSSKIQGVTSQNMLMLVFTSASSWNLGI